MQRLGLRGGLSDYPVAFITILGVVTESDMSRLFVRKPESRKGKKEE